MSLEKLVTIDPSISFEGRAVRVGQLDMFKEGDIVVGERLERRHSVYARNASGIIVSSELVIPTLYMASFSYSVPSLTGMSCATCIRTDDYVRAQGGKLYVKKDRG